MVGQNTKAIALLFGQNWLIFFTFQSALKINQCQCRSSVAHFWANYQGYSLTFCPKLAHCHHFSICNQNQSISISFSFRSWLGKIPRLQPYFMAKIGSFSSLFNLQSTSINFNCSLIFGQNTKAIALLFGQNWLIVITFQSAIKINQFQFRSVFAHGWAKYQGYSLTQSISIFWPKLAHCHHFSICNQNQSISISVIFRSFLGKIPSLQPYFLAKIGSFSSLFNLQSKSINFNFGHFSFVFGQNTKSTALLFGKKLAQFHHSSICNQNQSISISVIFRSFVGNLQSKYQGYSLTFWPKLAHFHHFSICNQNQSISSVRSFLGKMPRLQPYFLAKIGSFSSLFNLQSKSINFNFGHVSLIFGQNTKAIALLFGQNWLIFITFQSTIKINQCQFRSFFAHLWAKYQGYSLTVWPKLAHFHHFSICNRNQSISSVRSFLGKIPRLQPYFLAKIGSLSSLFNLQSKSINFNFVQFSLMVGQNTKAIALLYGQNWLIFITFQSAIKINQFQLFAHLWAKYQGYSLTFWPKLAHFHHFSICNQNQSISISVMFRSFLGKIPRLQPYCLAKIGSFSSLFNLQSKSINFNVGHFSLICGQNTKAIALLFGQNWLSFITFQSAIKINQFQVFAHFWAKYQGYSLTFWPKLAHCSVFAWLGKITFQSAIKINQFQFRSVFAHGWAKYQGYSLTLWPKLAHFHHFSICNQNQSISISVMFRSFLGKIPSLQPYFLAKNWLIFITCQSAIKINQFQFRSFFAHLWAKYQGYSLTFWPKLAHFHHFSICNQNQSISSVRSFLGKIPRLQPYFLAKIGSLSSLFNLQSKSIKFNFVQLSLMVGQNTKAIALLFGQNWLIFITSICNQNQSISISVIYRSFLGKIPRLQPYFLAKIGSFSSLFNLQSKSINLNFSLIFGQNTKAIALLFGQNWLIFITFQSAIKINQFQFRSCFAHLWAKYQGYSLTVWPKLAHFHHISICNQNQSISISVMCRSFLGKIPRLQPYCLAKIGSLSSLFNLQSKSINFNFGHLSLIFGQNTKAIALLCGQNWLIFITFESAVKINVVEE